MKQMIFLCLTGLFLPGCYRQSPPDVVSQYLTAISEGHCNIASTLVVDGGKEHLQAMIDMGCEPYELSNITKIKCEEQDTTAHCDCFFENQGIRWNLGFDLKLRDNEWKISWIGEPNR